MAESKKNLNRLGVVGLRRTGNDVFEEFLSELRWPRAGKIYQQMADNDPVVGSILYLAEMLIRGATWEVEAASDSPEDIDAARFLKECMNDLETSWANTISEVLSMLTYGFSFHEILYKVRRGPEEKDPKYKSKYTDGKFGWRGFPIRSQASWDHWEFDENTLEVSTFVQMPEPTYEEIKIPIEKGLLFRTRVSRNNPEGKSLLRNAYRPYFFKQRFEEIEGIGIERDLAGLPILTTPEDLDLWDVDDKEMVRLRGEAEALVSSVRRDSQEGIILPAGWELKLLSSGSNRQINIGEVIARYDNRIAITMLADIVLIGTNVSGSYALADVKQGMLSDALQAQLLNIADVFNDSAVPKLFQFNNWNVERYPEIKPGRIDTPTIKEIALMLRAAGFDITKDIKLNNYLRDLLIMPQLSGEEFNAIYTEQIIDGEQMPTITEEGAANNYVDNQFEQNDMSRMTGEENN